MNRFVLDASVTVSWFFEDEAGEYTAAVMESLAEWAVVVPSLWSLEVSNVLLVGERRGRCSEADAVRFLELLSHLPIVVDEETARRALGSTMQLAREYALTAYDAAYLELAMRLGLPLATLDQKLREAALRAGVAVHCA